MFRGCRGGQSRESNLPLIVSPGLIGRGAHLPLLPAWSTMILCPATRIEPRRENELVLGAAVKAKLPSPSPLAPGSIVSQLSKLLAVQAQPPAAVMTILPA